MLKEIQVCYMTLKMAKDNPRCKRCNKEIEPEEFRVTWKEHSLKPISIELELNFHKECWIEHYNESIEKKVKYMAKNILKNAQPMIKEFAGRMGMAS